MEQTFSTKYLKDYHNLLLSDYELKRKTRAKSLERREDFHRSNAYIPDTSYIVNTSVSQMLYNESSSDTTTSDNYTCDPDISSWG